MAVTLADGSEHGAQVKRPRLVYRPNRLRQPEVPPDPFALPSENESGRDFLTGAPLASRGQTPTATKAVQTQAAAKAPAGAPAAGAAVQALREGRVASPAVASALAASPDVAAKLYPDQAKWSRMLGVPPTDAAMKTAIGTSATGAARTPADAAAKAAFDSRFVNGQFRPTAPGRLPFPGAEAVAEPGVMAEAGKAPPVATTPKGTGTVDPNAGVAKPGATFVRPALASFDPEVQPQQTVAGTPINASLENSDPALALPPTGAFMAGQKVRGALGRAYDATKNFLGNVINSAAAGDPEARRAQIVQEQIGPVATAGLTAAGDFASGLGKATTAGVSNAQAAGFETPTKDSPVPKTPTTPVLNPDEDENSIMKFGGLNRSLWAGNFGG